MVWFIKCRLAICLVKLLNVAFNSRDTHSNFFIVYDVKMCLSVVRSKSKMDKAKKELTNSLGRSPYPPYPNSQRTDSSPGTSSTPVDASYRTFNKKYPVVKERGFYSDVLTPGASDLLGVSI